MEPTVTEQRPEGDTPELPYAALRPLLISYAYAVTGSREAAADIVQDVFLKTLEQPEAGIRDIRSYLTKSVINLSINEVKRSRRVSSYPGIWLPEPVATDTADGPLKQSDILSYTLLVLLEKLDARQRAVFVLREAFGFEHTEIAECLQLSHAYCRQLLSRAKKRLHAPQTANYQKNSLPTEYLEAIQSGDLERLKALFRDDIYAVSDGGGLVPAARRPVTGRERVAAFVEGMYHKFRRRRVTAVVNHQPALLFYEGERLVTCQVFSVDNNLISSFFFLRNPQKLGFLEKQLSHPAW